MGIDTFGSSLSGDLIYLAKIVCRPAAQNLVGHKEFIGIRWQAMGGGVRMALGGVLVGLHILVFSVNYDRLHEGPGRGPSYNPQC